MDSPSFNILMRKIQIDQARLYDTILRVGRLPKKNPPARAGGVRKFWSFGLNLKPNPDPTAPITATGVEFAQGTYAPLVEIPIIGVDHNSQTPVETTIFGMPTIAFPVASNKGRGAACCGKRAQGNDGGNRSLRKKFIHRIHLFSQI
jgi:hypothetical protein